MAHTSGSTSGSQAPSPSPLAPPRPSARSSATTRTSATAPTRSTTSTSAAPNPSSSAAVTIPSSSAQAQPAPVPVNEGTDHDHEAINVDDDDVPIGGKRKLKSDVWLEFEPVEVAGKSKAQCKWCKKLLVGGCRSGTTHLRSHLASCQSRQVRKGLKQATLKLSKDEHGGVAVEKYVFDQHVARKELALMICIHEYPLSMVDHAGFRRFCAALQPLFKVVSRNTIKRDILDMYEVQRRTLVDYFQRCQSRIAVTTDMWTANHQKKGYMSVTVHFIDNDWKLKSFLLRFIYVRAPHTGEIISDVLYEVLQDWQIEKKVSTVTLDNCTTNDNLMGSMQDKLSLPSLMLNGAASKNVVVNEGDDIMFGIFDKFLSEEPEECSTYLRTEMDLYLEEPTLPRTQELDIISCWQYAGIKYPTLRKIARDIMAIPVTTVASESVFSTGGRVISPHRSRLSPKTVEGLMCMQAWSRANMMGDQSCFICGLMTCLEEEDEEMDEPDSTIVD